MYPAWANHAAASSGVIAATASRTAACNACCVRGPRSRRIAFSLENACSMGLKSSEQGGRKSRSQPRGEGLTDVFPHVAGMPLEMYMPGGPRSVQRAILRVVWLRQTDPDLERLRCAMWRSLLYQAIWVVGCFFIMSRVIAPVAMRLGASKRGVRIKNE